MKALILSAISVVVNAYSLQDVIDSIEQQVMPQSVVVLNHFDRADGVTVVDEEGNIIYEDLSFELQDILPEDEQQGEESQEEEELAAEE